MNKKIICIMLCLTGLLTGCSSSRDIISYHPEAQTKVQLAEEKQEKLFASDLAVIKEEELDTEDSVMKSSASLVMNRTTGEVVYANNAFAKLYPASITKISTALMALKYGKLDDMVTISYNASHITESGAKLCGFLEGDQISLRSLLNSMLVYSGNDAAIAIAEHLYGTESEFSKKVNEEMKTLGATHTNFINSHGLDHKEHYTTAYDLYLIFNELLKYEEFTSIIKKDLFKAEYKTADGRQVLKYLENTNQYLIGIKEAPPGITVLGGKTGTTTNAGYCLILYSKDSKGNEYISLVLNAENKPQLYQQMNHLLEKIPA